MSDAKQDRSPHQHRRREQAQNRRAKPFHCGQCREKSFATKAALEQHVRDKHGEAG